MNLPAEQIPVAEHDPVETLATTLRTKHKSQITGELVIPAKDGQYASFPEALNKDLASALKARGLQQLYTHQARAWDSIQTGKHTVVVTPTASGKTLCYNLSVLQAAMQDKAKALYMFPTKALAQDQVAELQELNKAGELGIRAFTFDGDTPGDARKAVRTKGDIVVTNPDMLHQGILPHHTKWAQFFEGLRYIVIDEMHTYRGYCQVNEIETVQPIDGYIPLLSGHNLGARHRLPFTECPRTKLAIVNRSRQMPTQPEQIAYHAINRKKALSLSS